MRRNPVARGLLFMGRKFDELRPFFKRISNAFQKLLIKNANYMAHKVW